MPGANIYYGIIQGYTGACFTVHDCTQCYVVNTYRFNPLFNLITMFEDYFIIFRFIALLKSVHLFADTKLSLCLYGLFIKTQPVF